jgi:hypothetical protein
MAALVKEIPMATMIRVGAGTLVDPRFQHDVLEEIRIMAEAAQAALAETTVPPARLPSPFARLLGRVLAFH